MELKKNNDWIRKYMEEVIGSSYIIGIALQDFETTYELENFVKTMNDKNIGVTISAHHSNAYQGVCVNIYDRKTCSDFNKNIILKDT